MLLTQLRLPLVVTGDMEVAALHQPCQGGQPGAGALDEVLQGPERQRPPRRGGRILLCQVQQEGVNASCVTQRSNALDPIQRFGITLSMQGESSHLLLSNAENVQTVPGLVVPGVILTNILCATLGPVVLDPRECIG